MVFNASDFWSNPLGNVISCYTDVLGGFFFAVIMFMFMGYVLMKTESWATTSVVGLLISICFAAVLPSIVMFIIVVLVVFVFASIVVDVVIL